MCGTVALGLLGGLVASKLLFRRRWHHRHGGAGFRRFRDRRFGAAPPPPVDTARTLDKLLAPLELNERQAEEAREAFADVAQVLGPRYPQWNGLEEALAAVAAEPFDRARAQASLAGVEPDPAKNAVDALEHVHNILTPEQRDKLDQLLLGKSEWR
jgi:hypothetical protein